MSTRKKWIQLGETFYSDIPQHMRNLGRCFITWYSSRLDYFNISSSRIFIFQAGSETIVKDSFDVGHPVHLRNNSIGDVYIFPFSNVINRWSNSLR
jgi:hypothetical protein